jgi:uncharacterized protein (DUF1330 family)
MPLCVAGRGGGRYHGATTKTNQSPPALHDTRSAARRGKRMPGYFIAFVDVSDPEKYKNYTALTPAAIEAHGGEFVVRGGACEAVEGPAENRRVVVIKFPSVEAAHAFWNSPEYARAKQERVGAAVMHAMVVEGIA